MRAADHEPGCALEPLSWLRHAVGSGKLRLAGLTEAPGFPGYEALLEALDQLTRAEDWREVTLLDVSRYATRGLRDGPQCRCERRVPTDMPG